MAKPKTRYIRKNRQVKFTIDIPEDIKDDEDFLNELACTLDGNGWQMGLAEGDISVDINKIQIGDLVATPEDEE